MSIAARILESHGGYLELMDENGKGATFVITLPMEEALS